MTLKAFTPQHTLQEIRLEMRQARDVWYRLRLSLIELLIENPRIKIREIKEKLLISTASIYQWTECYSQKGLAGLASIKRNGGNHNKSKINPEHLDALKAEIDQQDRYWSIPLMQAWLQEHCGISIPAETLRYQMSKRYSYKSGRPAPDKGDRDAQGRFKKRDFQLS